MKPKILDAGRLAQIRRRLVTLYGDDRAGRLLERVCMTVGRYGVGARSGTGKKTLPTRPRWDQDDVFLITYADMVRGEGRMPLAHLKRFCDKRLRGAVSGVHILPFSPWSSDDGFSVIDYRKVEPEYGSWADVEALGEHFKLMFDLVLNHCSAQGPWFRDFVNGIDPAQHYFLEADPAEDHSRVVRPRPWPLLTPVQTRGGERHVWTTFSSDQVDLDWSNPDVLFEFIDILFGYITRGMRVVRLDAVAFLWKEAGTDCLHRPRTHEVVKLLRDILELVAPEVVVITETNVPHEENVSYFGAGDEAHMVYQFSLPPLLLHTLLRGDASHLTQWAANLGEPPPGCTFFNFTASHDGVGVRPLEGLLGDSELEGLIGEVRARGGQVSTRRRADGSESPYELNTTYADALADPADPPLGRSRFHCSQAVALALRGVPAVYFHSLMGTHNDAAGAGRTGQARSLNRHKWDREELTRLIDDPDDHHGIVFGRYLSLLRRRAGRPAFHPDGKQEVLDLGPEVFALVRTPPAGLGGEPIVSLFNVTGGRVSVPAGAIAAHLGGAANYRELLGRKNYKTTARKKINLAPYQAKWITPLAEEGAG